MLLSESNSKHKQISTASPQCLAGGFTIVELMIAVALSLLMAAAAGSLYVSQKKASISSRELVKVQEDGRIAIDAIARDIRSASDFGCQKGETLNMLNTDKAIDFTAAPVQAYAADGMVSTALGSSLVTTGTTLNSDVLLISGATGSLTYLTSSMSDATSPLTVSIVKPGFKTGDIAAISNCNYTNIFEVSSYATGTSNATMSFGTGSSGSGGGNKTAEMNNTYAVGTQIARLGTVWWYLGKPDHMPQGLYRVDGTRGTQAFISPLVRSFAVTYDLDTGTDGQADVYDQPRSAINGSDWSKVVQVHIKVLLRSEKGISEEAQNAFTFNGTTITPVKDTTLNKGKYYYYLPLELSTRLRNL